MFALLCVCMCIDDNENGRVSSRWVTSENIPLVFCYRIGDDAYH